MKLINISLPACSVAGTFGVRVADHAPGWNACGGPVNPANGTNRMIITPPTGDRFSGVPSITCERIKK